METLDLKDTRVGSINFKSDLASNLPRSFHLSTINSIQSTKHVACDLSCDDLKVHIAVRSTRPRNPHGGRRIFGS